MRGPPGTALQDSELLTQGEVFCGEFQPDLISLREIEIVSYPKHMTLHRFSLESILADCHKSSDTNQDEVFGRYDENACVPQ